MVFKKNCPCLRSTGCKTSDTTKPNAKLKKKKNVARSYKSEVCLYFAGVSYLDRTCHAPARIDSRRVQGSKAPKGVAVLLVRVFKNY